MHLHSARQEELGLVLEWIDTVLGALRAHAIGHARATHHIVGHGLGWAVTASLMVGHALRVHALRLLMVVLVQLVNVETATSLVHVDARCGTINRALYLNGLRSVALLSVELATVHGLDVHDVARPTVRTARVIRSRHDRLACWIEAKVRLVHQLLVEARVHRRVVVVDGLVDVVSALGVDLGSILEELVQYGLLLVIVDVHALPLYSATITKAK